MKRTYIWVLLAALVAVAGGLVAQRWFASPPVPLATGTWLPRARHLPDFHLADFNGAEFGRAQLEGHPTLLFFGFTYCPNVCPTTLATLASALRKSPLPGVRVVFVTVDPERDSAENLRRYLGAFSHDFIGVRGETAALEPLLKGLNAVAVKTSLPDGSYTMDHSAVVYLLDAHAGLRAVFTPPHTTAGLAADFARIVAANAL